MYYFVFDIFCPSVEYMCRRRSAGFPDGIPPTCTLACPGTRHLCLSVRFAQGVE